MKQRHALAAGVEARRVKRNRDGKSYLEAFFIVDQLNAILGFERWSYELMELTPVVSTKVPKKSGGDQAYAAYRCRLKLSVVFDSGEECTREDVGFGSGYGGVTAPGDAHESAGKEAVSDGLKRAARTLGCQFGNSLYDKDNPIHNGQGDWWGRVPPVKSPPVRQGSTQGMSELPAPPAEAPQHHDPTFEAERTWFMGELRSMGVGYEQVCGWLKGEGQPRPSQMDRAGRRSVLTWVNARLQSEIKQAKADKVSDDDQIPF